MNNLKIELTQVNKRNEETFQATANLLMVNDKLDDTVKNVVEFIYKTLTAQSKLRELGFGSTNGLKKSSPLIFKISSIDDGEEIVSLKLKNFVSKVEKNGAKNTTDALIIQIDLVQTFANWSKK